MSLSLALSGNLRSLESLAALLPTLDSATYGRVPRPTFTASAGAHVRHVLDHYQCLVTGLESGEINYEQREREPRVETEPEFALQVLGRHQQSLSELRQQLLKGRDVPAVRLRVLSDAGGTEHELETSLLRELAFLQNHNTHHFAMIAAILRHLGLGIDATLGVAPATLRHQAHQQCAQ